MEYNLLLKEYDKHCNQFIKGFIPLKMFIELEDIYIKNTNYF